jgi:hypothetical protein
MEIIALTFLDSLHTLCLWHFIHQQKCWIDRSSKSLLMLALKMKFILNLTSILILFDVNKTVTLQIYIAFMAKIQLIIEHFCWMVLTGVDKTY